MTQATDSFLCLHQHHHDLGLNQVLRKVFTAPLSLQAISATQLQGSFFETQGDVAEASVFRNTWVCVPLVWLIATTHLNELLIFETRYSILQIVYNSQMEAA